MQPYVYRVYFYAAKIDDAVVHQAKVCSSCLAASGHALRQVGHVPKQANKILTILPHPNCFHFPDFPVPRGGLLYKDFPSTAETGPCLSRKYHTFKKFQNSLDEVRCQTKIKKITFLPGF